ncbi:DUF5686 and carboxypeptidase-like regulatory domain-containing protein [Lutibacter sp. B1]|uniref:DUF5686 and carboxypeptidase-like regulatory domain-containing protein n=1 Tax=Lutibacter sp. B1 TaxID=2725996 RepID=UPI001456B215|nr:DUF5686 and carboxypeptidase-like regulatory domain-containing protein [Lutibacter sp. B1]NLP57722.1 carboxypeptidase-like regulatory domain-containing protein [Lutibacter sp. B1]
MKKILFLLFLSPFLLFSQNYVQGIVIDSKTKQPLAFASIITNTNFGTLTDVEGKFEITTQKPFDEISVSYVGYTPTNIVLNNQKFISIKLKSKVENLNEVLIIAKENPANKIIKNAIANKEKNDIEKALNSFKFNSYNKKLVTANPDSISGTIDTIFVLKNGKKEFKKLDSSNYQFKKEITEHHLYITEKISEFNFQKGKKKKEIILASRMAGLKQPIYEILAITIQDFSFYNEYYTIAGTKYTSPIANNALKKYNYKILDTVKNSNGNAILIYFKPKKKIDVAGVEGVMYIDDKTYAITKAVSEVKGSINIKSTQNFEYINNYGIWFPSNMDLVIKKGTNNENIELFGGVVKISENKKNDSIIKSKTKQPSDIVYFISKTENSNIEINTPVVVKKSSSTIQFNEDAHKQSLDFWNKYRTDSLTKRGETAYKKLDSIAESEGVEKKINIARNVLKGYYPTKYINLNLGKIINLNNYEGLRIGFGGVTNTNFSNKYKIESYIAYGTKDEDIKYSIGASTRLNKDTNTWLGANYTNDLKEAASLDFIAENTSFSPINPRNLNISKFYNYKTASIYLEHDIQPNLEAKLQLSSGDYKPVFDYQYITSGKITTNYTLTTAALGLQYNPKNEYMNSPLGKLKIKNDYPQITFQITKSFKNVFSSDFDFTQVNLRLLHEIKRLRKATTEILVEGGIVLGDAPISHLFNSTPNYTFKSPWLKRVTFAGKNSFETMGYNEFISDKFGAIHIRHQLRYFRIGSKFKPQVTLVTRAAIGNLENPSNHKGLEFKSLQNGYFESGIEFNSIFKGFGLSSFYRYGSYQNSRFSDNIALKLTYQLRLGF